ncbi:uncharacterized protein LOC120343266 [Styela clava]
MTSIGIDFGTSYCCVAIHRNGKTEVIPNEHDQRLTSSYIAFTEDERLFGDAAQHQTPLNLKNTLYQIKSLVGRTVDDDIVRKHKKYWGFDVIHNSSKNEIKIPITFRGKNFELNPVQVTAMIFENLKEMANNYIGEKVDNAVISVPVCFNKFQHNAIRDAGFVSGFKNVELIKEPRAAALAFSSNQNNPAKRVVLIFDIGAGKFDTGIYDVDVNGESIKRVLGETGNSSFGGDDFDYELVDYILQSAGNITPDKKAIYRLKKSCEKAKKSLSSAKRARLQIDRFVGDDSYNQVLMVDEFEKVSSTEFEEIEKVLSDVLKVADITKEQVNDIVLVGGSTRIPKIRKNLSDFFDGKTLNQTVNPDEAVACGAAIYADKFFKNSEIEEDPRTNSDDIRKMIQQNAVFSKEDADLRLLNEKRNELENYIYRVKQNVESSSNNKINREEAKIYLENCDNTLIWLGDNQDAAILDEVERRLNNLKHAVEGLQQPKRPNQEDKVPQLTEQKQLSEQKIEDELKKGEKSKPAKGTSTPEKQFQNNSEKKTTSTKGAALPNANKRVSEPERIESSAESKSLPETTKRTNKSTVQHYEPKKEDMHKNKKIQQNAIFNQEDEDSRLLTEKRNELKNYIYRVKPNVQTSSNNENNREEAERFLKHCDKTLIWLNKRQDAANLNEVERRLNNIKRAFEGLQPSKRPDPEDEVHKLTEQEQLSEQKIEDEHEIKEPVSVPSVSAEKVGMNQSQHKSKVAARRHPLSAKSKGVKDKVIPGNSQVQSNFEAKTSTKDAALGKLNNRLLGRDNPQQPKANPAKIGNTKKNAARVQTPVLNNIVLSGKLCEKLSQKQLPATNIQQHHGKNTNQYQLNPPYPVFSPEGVKISVKGRKMGTERSKPSATSTPLRNDADYDKKRDRQDLEILLTDIEKKYDQYNAAEKRNLWDGCNQARILLENKKRKEFTEKWNKLHKAWQIVEKKYSKPRPSSGWRK